MEYFGLSNHELTNLHKVYPFKNKVDNLSRYVSFSGIFWHTSLISLLHLTPVSGNVRVLISLLLSDSPVPAVWWNEERTEESFQSPLTSPMFIRTYNDVQPLRRQWRSVCVNHYFLTFYCILSRTRASSLQLRGQTRWGTAGRKLRLHLQSVLHTAAVCLASTYTTPRLHITQHHDRFLDAESVSCIDSILSRRHQQSPPSSILYQCTTDM